jgi:hypothetical protein
MAANRKREKEEKGGKKRKEKKISHQHLGAPHCYVFGWK